MVVGNENYDFHEMEKVCFIVDDCVVCENISFIPYILAYQIQKIHCFTLGKKSFS